MVLEDLGLDRRSISGKKTMLVGRKARLQGLCRHLHWWVSDSSAHPAPAHHTCGHRLKHFYNDHYVWRKKAVIKRQQQLNNKDKYHSSPTACLVSGSWKFSSTRWKIFSTFLLDPGFLVGLPFSRCRSNLCGCRGLGRRLIHGCLVRFTSFVLKRFSSSFSPCQRKSWCLKSKNYPELWRCVTNCFAPTPFCPADRSNLLLKHNYFVK